MAEGENGGSRSFLLCSQKNPLVSQLLSGSPVASLTLTRAGPSKSARQNTTAPGGNQTGEHEQMNQKKVDRLLARAKRAGIMAFHFDQENRDAVTRLTGRTSNREIAAHFAAIGIREKRGSAHYKDCLARRDRAGYADTARSLLSIGIRREAAIEAAFCQMRSAAVRGERRSGV